MNNKDEGINMIGDDLVITTVGDSNRLLSISKTFTKKQLIKVVDKQVRSLAEHYEDNKYPWDLDGTIIISEILYELMGMHLSEAIYGYINEKLNTHTEYNKRGVFVIVPRKYVYYDTNKDNIVISKKIKNDERYVVMGIL